MQQKNIEKIITTADEIFDMEKNYKLFRFTQKLLNPTWYLKDKYLNEELVLQERKISLRIFNPFTDKLPHEILIFIHGGGWVSGSLESYTKICHQLAEKLERIVIAIDYRLAPEHPFPAGFNDCYEAVKKIYQTAQKLGIKSKDIVLMGDSAGGNLTAAVSQKAHDTKEFKVSKQVLLYPALQPDYSKTTKYKSVLENATNQLLTRKHLESFIKMYLPRKDLKENKYVSPLLANKLFGLPKTLLIVGSKDPLHDEGIMYVKKLKRHLVNCKYYVLKDAKHGFLTNILDKKYTSIAISKIIDFL